MGDEKSFLILFDLYKDRFYAVAYKMTRTAETAREMVQEVFLKIWKNRETLPSISNPESYFFTMLYRQVYRHYKKLALERKLLSLIAESPAFRDITDETLLARESERLINEAVARLPRQQQLVFRLSKQDGMSREQVAEILQISPNTVKNHMAEAMKYIRTYLKHAAMLYLLLAKLWL